MQQMNKSNPLVGIQNQSGLNPAVNRNQGFHQNAILSPVHNNPNGRNNFYGSPYPQPRVSQAQAHAQAQNLQTSQIPPQLLGQLKQEQYLAYQQAMAQLPPSEMRKYAEQLRYEQMMKHRMAAQHYQNPSAFPMGPPSNHGFHPHMMKHRPTIESSISLEKIVIPPAEKRKIGPPTFAQYLMEKNEYEKEVAYSKALRSKRDEHISFLKRKKKVEELERDERIATLTNLHGRSTLQIVNVSRRLLNAEYM